MHRPQLLFFLSLLFISQACTEGAKIGESSNKQDQKEVIQQTLTAM